MSFLRIALILTALAFCGCSTSTEHRSNPARGARDVVEKLFVERLISPETFQYFHFWGLDAVKPYFDEPILSDYLNFKKMYDQRVAYLAKRGFLDKFGLGSFPIFARVDPLTMCAAKPLKIEVSRISENDTSAVYKVKYIQLGNYARYSSVRTVSLVKINEKWLLAGVSTSIRDAGSETKSTFGSQLKFLAEKLYSETGKLGVGVEWH